MKRETLENGAVLIHHGNGITELERTPEVKARQRKAMGSFAARCAKAYDSVGKTEDAAAARAHHDRLTKGI